MPARLVNASTRRATESPAISAGCPTAQAKFGSRMFGRFRIAAVRKTMRSIAFALDHIRLVRFLEADSLVEAGRFGRRGEHVLDFL
ncbi:MAG: hypothetical protein K0Q73_8660, partial [Paenibacillus sp.]|nr:hypothetical protein [Paenibacillus sp.]